MEKLLVMRGLPGSGKTHWVTNNVLDPHIISADIKRMKNGEYIYRKEDDAAIHAACLRECALALANFSPPGPEDLERTLDYTLVIDNTNIRAYEFAPYYRLGEAFGFEVELIWVVAPLEVCLARNTHQVPEATIRTMAASFEPFPPWWKFRIVTN